MDSTLFIAMISLTVLGGPMISSVGHGIMRKRAGKTYRKGGSVRWFSRPGNQPSIYILRSSADPTLFKIGYTSRSVKSRAAEIVSRRGEVRIIGWFTMPHAYAAEQRVHRKMPLRRGVVSMGNEWYRVTSPNAEKDLVSAVQKEVNAIRTIAMMKMSWPPGSKVRWFQAA